MPHPRSLRRALTLVVVALSGLLSASSTASAAPVVFGLGDQSPAMFTDPLWTSQPLKNTRRIVDWDTPQYPAKVADLDAWMTAAHTAGATPLIAIEHSWTAGRLTLKPTVAQYTTLITWLKGRYPWWNTLTPWNEANYNSQPTFRNPALAAQYWKAAKTACVGCTVTSPSIVAWDGAPKKWLAQFQAATKNKVKLWAVHIYGDQNRLTDIHLKAFEKSVKGQIWVTEAAGWVRFTLPKWPINQARAAKVITYTFQVAKKHSARVKRWYFYQWRGPSSPLATWDSGVLNPDGTTRPGYQALVAGLAGA
ncbi:MAG: glycosyl hydrolase [Solirubrobacteraceae bacterium]